MLYSRPKVIKPFGKSINEVLPKVIFCDRKKELCEILGRRFHDVGQVKVVHGNLFKVKANALVSPANSFGDMGGGIDRAIDEFYKRQAQPKFRRHICLAFYGELPVGMATILEMGTTQFPYLIASPTMRVPGMLRKDSINVYLSLRASLVQVLKFNENHNRKITSLVVPGLGTGVGGMAFEEAAQQMYEAYYAIFENGWEEVFHPAMAPFALRKS